MCRLVPKYYSQSSIQNITVYWVRLPACLLLIFGLGSCEPKNEPPIAKLEASPLSGEIPMEVRFKVSGQDPDGVEDIKQYVLYIGPETVKSNTPIDIKRTFETPGTVEIYGEVVDSEDQSNKTVASSLILTLTEGLEQSAVLLNSNEIEYSAILKKIANAELTINKDGILFLRQSITDISITGSDYQKIFKYNPDGLTKGTYEFILKAGNLEKKTTVVIPNYKPTLNLSGINSDVLEGTVITLDLSGKVNDLNPEDLPVSINGARSLDGKTQVSLNGNLVKIKAHWDKSGTYQVEFDFGSTTGGSEKLVLTGGIIDDPRWRINPFVQPNDSTLNWYGSGDVNKDNVLNSQDVTRIAELINETYSNPSDIRLNDRADVNGDGVVNTSDRQVLENRVNGVLSYMPGEWNMLTTKSERVSWLTKMLAIDKTDEMPYIPGEWVCGDFARQTILNFHGCGELGFGEKKGLADNGRFNIPLYYAGISIGHAINITITGDNLETFEDGTYTEPQADYVVIPGMWDMPVNCQVDIRMPFDKNKWDFIELINFNLDNSVPSLTWINGDPNLNIIKHR